MAHKTLINGTAYEISGGKTLVGGTAYSIKNGKTLVGGTAYGVEFAKLVTTLILHLIVTGEAILYTTDAGTYTYTTTSSNPKIVVSSDGGMVLAYFGEDAWADANMLEGGGEYRLFSSAGGYCNGFATSENGSPEFYYKELTAGETYELWAEVYL